MKETELRIRIYGDKVLRRKSTSVAQIGDEERALIHKMSEIMYASGGIGLAASQVGINKQIIIIDIGQGLFKFINPEIKAREGYDVMEEGCLSLPGVSVKVKRARKIFVEGTDEFNRKLSFWADSLFSRALQHEIDHLKGRLIIDYANLVKRISIRRKFRNQLNSAKAL